METSSITKRGVLFVNLGTPEGYGVDDIRNYLAEFLMDERVINLSPFWRSLLVKRIILPFRASRSAAAYKRIWTAQGSPMLVLMNQLIAQVQEQSHYPVAMGMRYGKPSIRTGVEKLRSDGVQEILLIPMYPQYTQSTYESALVEFSKIMRETDGMDYDLIPPFYSHPDYLEAMAHVIAESKAYQDSEHLLFSFHGVPMSHIKQQDGMPTDYQQECKDTAFMLANMLRLREDQWSVGFQSRMGKGKWTQPYTDRVIEELARQGVRKIAVVAPSFTIDCLETLEELALDGKEFYQSKGGEELHLIPCLNAHPVWIEKLVGWINCWKGCMPEEFDYDENPEQKYMQYMRVDPNDPDQIIEELQGGKNE